jgi:hypothetical protein
MRHKYEGVRVGSDEEEMRWSEDGDSMPNEIVPGSCCSQYARDGTLEIVIPLTFIALLALCVIGYNFFRLDAVLPCDESIPMAKHFYCFDRTAAPGVHTDSV